MNAALLIDFGSTFTKVCSVDLDSEMILGTAQAPTTVRTDISIGLKEAFSILKETTGIETYTARLACSSAAGGLSVMASGVVESLTLKAARMAALGAGAKVTRGFHHYLTNSDLKIIEAEPPDIFLLAGGTDGGNSEIIIHNAGKLAGLKRAFPIVVAGNRAAADEVQTLLESAGWEVHVCPNIMPELDRLDIDPVNEIIRSIFLSRITHAKGIDKAGEFIDGVLMPTPYAVLSAAVLLADGTEEESGAGGLMVIDAGGATTDVHSVYDGYEVSDDVILHGIREPRIKRTVEGDMGVRYNASTIVETTGKESGGGLSGSGKNGFFQGMDAREIGELLLEIGGHPEILFGDSKKEFDRALCKAAVHTAVKRHCGTYEKHYTPHGARYLQQGKDFTGLGTIIGTGGPLVNDSNPAETLSACLFDGREPDSLRPRKPEIMIDKKYILYAMGLLASIDAGKALRIMKKEIIKISQEQPDGNNR
ncbi:MAG: glutamate mutase L [Clostridia bacterium]|nr:glutamate mutase L [Clostridia bacterium]